MNLLALDPSIRCTGGLVVNLDGDGHDAPSARAHAFVAVTENETDKRRIFAGDDDARRAGEIVAGIERALSECGWPLPSLTAIAEQPSGARGAGGHPCSCGKGQHIPGIYRSAKAEGITLALVSIWCRSRHMELRWVQPGDVKFALLGRRSGSKDEMVAAADKPLLALGVDLAKWSKPKSEALADAYGVLVASGLWTSTGSGAAVSR